MEKKTKKRVFTVEIPFTYDKPYKKGESITLEHKKTIDNLLINKIIK